MYRMCRKLFSLLLVMMVFSVMVVPVTAQEGGEDELPSIAEIVVASAESDEPEFTMLLAAVEGAGLTAALDETGPYTVFAPTDAAFVALLEALEVDAETLLADTELLTSVLLYHVVPGVFYAEDVVSFDGERLATAFWGSSVEIAVSDEGATIDNANIIVTDIEASNGVIHVIDAVIVPGEDEGALREFPAGEQSVVEIASGSEDFATLTAAVLSSEDAATYLTEASFVTVFAPTNEAFANLLATLELSAEELLADTETVEAVLAYHVSPWAFRAEDVIALDGAFIGTLLPGYAIYISLDGEAAFADDSTITAVDVEASNGIIHVIDSVLLPTADEMEME
jgi:uncharacterized surface protein with fasciclin (FAS1) repeats